MTCACEKSFSAHRFFPGGLHFIEDQKPTSGADRRLILVNEALSGLYLPHPRPLSRWERGDVRAMDFEGRPFEIHERAGPWIEGPHPAF
jgi:hypothetical protein